MPWYDAIIEATDFGQRSGFSETETLGTWNSNFHLNEIEFQDLNWDRSGQTRFGYARHLNIRNLRQIGKDYNLDIVSFENWDYIGWRRFVRSVKYYFSS